ncbi:MAG: hypothetical protein RMI79_06710, partial [Nitrososphaerota archaeon]|nr:hypothetical protein [Nitrososphaerota archaeon]
MPFTNVKYYIEAVDNVGNRHQTSVSTYSVGMSFWLYVAVIAITVVLVVASLLRKACTPAHLCSILFPISKVILRRAIKLLFSY